MLNLNKMISLILSTIQEERLIECLEKKVYGLSDGIIKKIDKSIFNVNEDDILYIKLKKPFPMIFGPFKIIKNQLDIKPIQSKGVWIKVNKNKINKRLPWWIVEGFNWLIFFDLIDNRFFKIQETILKKANLFTPDYGVLRNDKDKELFNFLKNKGIEIRNNFNIIK